MSDGGASGENCANESIGEKSWPLAVRGKEEGEAGGVPCDDDEGEGAKRSEIKRPELWFNRLTRE